MSIGGKLKGKAILPDHQRGQARDKAAEMVGASPRYVLDAKQIERDAPEILDHVKQGKLSIPQAKQVAALPAAQRPAAIERIQKKETEEGCYLLAKPIGLYSFARNTLLSAIALRT